MLRLYSLMLYWQSEQTARRTDWITLNNQEMVSVTGITLESCDIVS
jgi:hypothetical protein